MHEASSDLGLRHALQNGLAIARGEAFEESRKVRALTGLHGILDEAYTGSEVVRSIASAAVVNVDRSALDRYSKFLGYLSSAGGDDLHDRLNGAVKTVEVLKEGKAPAQDAVAALEELLSDLLDALNRERTWAPLRAPGKLAYN